MGVPEWTASDEQKKLPIFLEELTTETQHTDGDD